ncbi:hypothetical protein B0H17DRAFT_1201161 [Mycena rosella]|uniref:Uncharacterized protein n=1 Tax=Mycena rosella TaxID=1033263 RepID=A0AAD7DH47_MYCRO|nr:hypothetical protein B0H17DRAFT_1201161 [Mycena rosella]
MASPGISGSPQYQNPPPPYRQPDFYVELSYPQPGAYHPKSCSKYSERVRLAIDGWEAAAEEPDHPQNSWLDKDLGEELKDDSDADYAHSEGSGSIETSIGAAAAVGWPSWRTLSQGKIEEREDLPRQIAELVKAEQAAAATYDPDVVVALVTELYELFVITEHLPEGSIQYPPHTKPSVNEALAGELGYNPSVISLMQKLPYVGTEGNRAGCIIPCTSFAGYTLDEDLIEGRCPYPYHKYDSCPDLDSWMLPLALPNFEGWNIILDTRLGVIRAYSTERSRAQKHTVEWRRHGEVLYTEWDRVRWTEYRRARLVPAAQYLSEVIYAYRSLAKVAGMWMDTTAREYREDWLDVYRQCGWPDEWRRAEFLANWAARLEEIEERGGVGRGRPFPRRSKNGG